MFANLNNSKTNFDIDNKIWFGDKVENLFNSNCSVGQVILYMLNRESDKILQVSANNGLKLTGNELADMSVRIALNLQKMGLQQEDIIGIVASNSHYLAPLVFGAFLSGISINALDPSFDKGEIRHMFDITRPKIIFCDATVLCKVHEALKEISYVCPTYTMKGIVDNTETIENFLLKTGKENEFLPFKLKKGGDQVAAILCSSGTTGLPKGVCVSHKMLLNMAAFPILKCDIALCFSTLYWLSGLLTLTIGTISGSKRIIIDEPFAPELCLKLVEEYKVSWLFTPPSQMAMCINCPDIKTRNLSSVKQYLSGGSHVPIEIIKEIQNYLPYCNVLVGYGMTEIASICCVEHSMKREGSVGQIAFNVEVKIIDETGNNLGIGENGEICIKTGLNCLGYYNNEVDTKNIIDIEGWIHSGDIGHFDSDGFLFIVDRKKEILKYKNFHFYPNEIECIIRQIPDVMEVCVCGIPDVIATDLPAAAIIKKASSNLTSKDIYDFVAEKMSHFKHLHGGVYFFESFPMTPSGKIQRRKLRDIIEELHKKNVN